MSILDDDFWDDLLGKEEEPQPPGIAYIPVLPSDYPLFDWDDWPESRDALVPGMPTKFFQRATWNAIVDTINDALAAAGVEWLDPRFHDRWEEVPYTVEDSKILRPYGQLTASAFNTVCNNVDIGTPVRWGWDVDPSFRGYVGKPRFRGTTVIYDDSGAISRVMYGDNVYPEYLFELVDRVNLMLELLRGTKPTVDTDARYIARSRMIHKGFQSLRSARISYRYLLKSSINSFSLGLYSGTDIKPREIARTKVGYDMELVPAAGIWRRIYSATIPVVSGKVYFKDQIQFFEMLHAAMTSVHVGAISMDPSSTSARALTWSSSNVLLSQTRNIKPATPKLVASTSNIVASAESTLFRAREAQHTSYSILSQPTLENHKRVLFDPRHISTTKTMLTLSMSKPAAVLLYDDFDFFVIGLVRDEPIRNRLLICRCWPLMRGNARIETPEARLMWLWSQYAGLGNARQMSPTPRLLELLDRDVNVASFRLEDPCPRYMRLRYTSISAAGHRSQEPTARYLRALDHMLHIAASRIEVPESVRLAMFDARKSVGYAISIAPTNAYIRSINYFIVRAGYRSEKPAELYLWFTRDAILIASSSSHDITRALQYLYDPLTGNAYFKATAPRARVMYMLDPRLNRTKARLDTPRKRWLLNLQDAIGFTSAKRQRPTSRYLYNKHRLIYYASASIEQPTMHMAYWLESVLTHTGCKTQAPSDDYAHWIDSIISYVAETVQTPTHALIRMLSNGVVSLFDPEIRQPSYRNLLSISGTVPYVSAQYQLPTSSLCTSAVSDLFKATATIRNMLAVYIQTAACMLERIYSIVAPVVQEPNSIEAVSAIPGISGYVNASFTDISFGSGSMVLPGISGHSSGHLAAAKATAGLLNIGRIQSIAGHSVLRLIASRGTAYIPRLWGYGDAHTAAAVASAGRPISLEFVTTFWCDVAVGKDFNVRMHIRITPIKGSAYGGTAGVAPSAGTLKIPHVTGTLHAQIIEPSNLQMSIISSSVGALAASGITQAPSAIGAMINVGTVQGSAGAITWSRTEQRGSVLYIRQTHEATLSDGVLTLY